jgi:hypothetical protein
MISEGVVLAEEVGEASVNKMRDRSYGTQSLQREDLKGKALRGGLVTVCAQAVKLVLRTGSLIVLARLLSPKDFGLVGMVTAVKGIL